MCMWHVACARVCVRACACACVHLPLAQSLEPLLMSGARAHRINVALSDDDDFVGGRLLGVFDGAVQAVGRSEGDATVHTSSLLHGVSRMRSGVRYSLICFVPGAVGRPRCARDTPRTHPPRTRPPRTTRAGYLSACLSSISSFVLFRWCLRRAAIMCTWLVRAPCAHSSDTE